MKKRQKAAGVVISLERSNTLHNGTLWYKGDGLPALEYFRESNPTKQPDEVTQACTAPYFLTGAKGGTGNGACHAGIEPDSLAA